MANEFTIKWLNKALNNLNDEAEYIALENPVAAQNTVIKIMSAIQLLASNPAQGRPGRITGTRELVIPETHYIVPYRTKNSCIEVLRVFHTARKPPSNWQ